MIQEQLLYSDYLYNRCVCIIGGGPDVDMGMINNADVLVFINDHWRKYQNKKCNVLYCGNAALGLPLFMEHETFNPDWVFLNYGLLLDNDQPIQTELLTQAVNAGAQVDRFYQVSFQNTNPFGPEYEWCNVLHKRINTMPLTGILAAYHLLMQPVQTLCMTGFSFYAVDGVIPYERNTHKLWSQIALIKNLADVDSRLVLDPVLYDICEGKYEYEKIEEQTYITDSGAIIKRRIRINAK